MREGRMGEGERVELEIIHMNFLQFEQHYPHADFPYQ